MASSSKPNHIRSISLPSRSHPSTQRVEEVLNNLKNMEISSMAADTVCNGLVGLGELHRCMDDLLNLPQTLQAISQIHNKKWVDELLEKSVEVLDICGIANDTISQLKQHLREALSSLRRRRKGDSSSLEATLTNYTSLRKKMNKDVKRSISSLKKKMDNNDDETIFQDSAVIRVLREANAVTISIFQVVLQFLAMPVLMRPKQSKWSVVSRLVHKGKVECESQEENTNNLETLESQLEVIENELGTTFRCLIKSRSSLLNTVSC
ncbi:PREDICTED: uncharacterized protein LOC109177558 [Ipomoea nil]|uniref:uncharacterized protein LOC109177558 n=1 Tax=Ipomoea nil TaxID=35883 RepID=UPI000901D5ED|nr:PREDICTED: uncharacterized protein LOC109177558 [Ipomoea nil]